MKSFVLLALVAGFVSSARAESPARCAEEVRQWCSYESSGVYNPAGFESYMIRNSNFCAVSDYRGTNGESGINTKVRTFKMRNGDVKTILIHTPSGVQGKCVPESWDFRHEGRDAGVTFLIQTQNKLWASTDQGNLLLMRLGPPNTYRAGRPEWFKITTESGQVLSRVARIAESPRRDGIVVTYDSGRKEEFKVADSAALVRTRSVPVTASSWNSY
jgi:hypothetical protein